MRTVSSTEASSTKASSTKRELSAVVLGLSLFISATAFVILLSSLLGQFVSRSVFNTGLIWADELARVCFVWCSFFGAVAAWQARALHRIDMLTRSLVGAVGSVVNRLVQLLISSALVYLIWYGSAMLWRALDQTTETLEISGAWLYLPVPLSAMLMLLSTWLPQASSDQSLPVQD